MTDSSSIRQVSPVEKKPSETLLSSPVQQNMNQVSAKPNYVAIAAILLSSLVLGSGSGYAIRQAQGSSSTSAPTGSAEDNKTVVITENEAGVDNSEAFPDSAVGILMEGGKDGEGTHYLDRGMGADKYVYLTSTVINMQKFVGKNVEVRGQTLSARKAGWLMDVGRIKVVQ